MSRLGEAIHQLAFLRSASPVELSRVEPHSELQVFARGESIWAEGQPTHEFHFVLRGRVKFSNCTREGRGLILQIAGPEELLCASAPCSFQPYCCEATAMEDDTELLVVSRPILMEIFERCPLVTRAFLQDVTCRSMSLCRRVEEVAAAPVAQRIAKLLLRLGEQIGIQRRGEIWIAITLSRQDLADMVGTTLETAIRVMSQLKRDNLVTTLNRGFLIRNHLTLCALAEGVSPPDSSSAVPRKKRIV